MSAVEFSGRTDAGSRRDRNEDSFLCMDLSARWPSGEGPAALFVVADGIGGQAGGGVASQVAADSIKAHLLRQLTVDPGSMDRRRLLVDAVQEANERILDKIGADTNLTGMGTTVVAALVSSGSAFVANVGDSRAYLVRERAIMQITQDHSWVAEQNRIRTVSEWELNRSPFRHMITRSLGLGPRVETDTFEIILAEGDCLLLCSDGLYGVLPDAEILRIILRSRNTDKACRKLIDAANRAGSRDNITAVVVRWGRTRRTTRGLFAAPASVRPGPGPTAGEEGPPVERRERRIGRRNREAGVDFRSGKK